MNQKSFISYQCKTWKIQISEEVRIQKPVDIPLFRGDQYNGRDFSSMRTSTAQLHVIRMRFARFMSRV